MSPFGITASRFLIGKPSPTGSVMVRDRETLEIFFIYQPVTDTEIDCGHIEGSWYWRPIDALGISPLSVPSPTLDEAIHSLARSQITKESH